MSLGSVLVVRIPLKRRTRGGRSLMVVSDASSTASGAYSRVNMARDTPLTDPVLKALGRAWRWKGLIEAGTSIADIATGEGVDKSYLCRLLRLSLLSPVVTESILDGALPKDLLLVDLIDSSVVDWTEQHRRTVGAAQTVAPKERAKLVS